MKTKLFAVTIAAASAFAAMPALAEDVYVVPDEVDSYVAERPFDEGASYDEDLVVGDTLPEDVVIRRIPEYQDFGYVVTDRYRVAVEPRTRRVIKIYN